MDTEFNKIPETQKNGVDPREYFKCTKFQMIAEEIDRNKNHPWVTARGDGFLVADQNGKIALATTFDSEEKDGENRIGFLLAETTPDGKAHSVFIRKELTKNARGMLFDAITNTSPRLLGEKRHAFVQTVIENIPYLAGRTDEEVAFLLTAITLNSLDDNPMEAEITEIPKIDRSSSEQQNQLDVLLRLASKKVPSDVFLGKLAIFQDNLRWMDDPFGRNFAHTLSETGKLVIADMPRHHDAIVNIKPTDFPIADMATVRFSTQDDLAKILLLLPFEQMPDTRSMSIGREQAEMVPLEKVLGGNNMENWMVSTSENRGLGKIYELCGKLITGEAKVAGNNSPIRAIENEGKFFIESDGRHRTAALKALQVKEVPMLVTHVK